jgi:SpoVK/Ycf46/Vps4 family AAA+-type ATPase
MTGADIATIVNAAAMTAIKEHVSSKKNSKKLSILMKHFESALDKVKTGSSKGGTASWQKFPGSRSLT